eukprot:SAG31_NODE_297_length_18175_cov_68.266659_3_plen_77_part_00
MADKTTLTPYPKAAGFAAKVVQQAFDRGLLVVRNFRRPRFRPVLPFFELSLLSFRYLDLLVVQMVSTVTNFNFLQR